MAIIRCTRADHSYLCPCEQLWTGLHKVEKSPAVIKEEGITAFFLCATLFSSALKPDISGNFITLMSWLFLEQIFYPVILLTTLSRVVLICLVSELVLDDSFFIFCEVHLLSQSIQMIHLHDFMKCWEVIQNREVWVSQWRSCSYFRDWFYL